MKHQRAFTLVELSIVLVILGLLIGGVLTGQSLIRAAELRSVSTQQARYMTAVQTFRDKYFGIPGDLTNAQSYWGVAHATPATCITTASTTALTCNGDGNGLIDVSAGSNERFRFWQHLANAGLIEGSYNGIAASTTWGTNNTNVPIGKMSASLWFTNNQMSALGSTVIFDGTYGNIFLFGQLVAGDQPFGPLMKPEELYNIDMKVDDGKPATGQLVMRAPTLASCTDTSTSSNFAANYLLSSATAACAAIFRQQF